MSLAPASNTEEVTAIVHFYRGELSRMIAWRDRLDRTTNWAIAASAAMLSVTLSSPESHHAVILCCMVLVFLLLAIESRRYRFFDVSRNRVRLLESLYYAPLFEPDAAASDWREQMGSDLRHPRFGLELRDAMSNRLRRNYAWIYVMLVLSWWLKVSTVVLDARTGDAQFVDSLAGLVNNADVAYIPGWVAVTGVCGFTVWMLYMVTRPRKRAEDAEAL
ncbi:MAG: DUF2270 domain-containing protein, partial [bacterium]|nr:DUF2270 domain-containing protein [bacterium]